MEQRCDGELLLHALAEASAKESVGTEIEGNKKGLICTQQVQEDLALCIEKYYSREPRHSTINNLRPIDYEQQIVAIRTLSLLNT